MDNSHRQAAFHQDGSLRDIYVQGVTLQHWEKFLSFIRTGNFGLR